MFSRTSSISNALAIALLASTPMPLPTIDTTRIHPYYPSGSGWSGSSRSNRPAGLTKPARKKKRRAERLERQRRGETAKYRSRSR